MNLKNFIGFVFSIIIVSVLSARDNSPFVRFPAVNSDGSKISFSFQGDIWVVGINGGDAERLTIHPGYEGRSKWSPDDKMIAFNSRRFGNNDIFTIPSNGGIPNRLTYHSAADLLSCWGENGDILFTTSRIFRQVEWDHEIYNVRSDGGTPFRFLDAVGEMPAISPNGRFAAFVRGWGRIVREDYRGPANTDIWIYDSISRKYSKLTDFMGNDFQPVWDGNGTLFFISSESGKYNIHSIDLDEKGAILGGIKQITNFNDDGVRYFDVSRDGSTIVFERQTHIYSLKLGKEGNPKKLAINISSDYRFDPVVHKTFSGSAGEYSISPNGKYSVFVVRGEVFIKKNDKEKSKSINLSNNSFRDQNAVWLNDTTIIFVSDRFGQNDLFMVRSSDDKITDIYKSLKHKITRLTETKKEESFPVISPDGKKIAYEIGSGKLVVADISAEGEMSNEIELLNGWAAPGNVSWSPDSKWLAYSLTDLYYNDEIYIQPADNSRKPVNVSMHPRGDYNPVWSADGSKLGFLSDRNNRNTDVWFVWLKKEDWQKTKEDWEEYDELKSEKKKNKDSTGVKPVKIDFNKIYERLEQVTSLPGDEGNIAISKDGKYFYFTSQSKTKKGSDIYSIKWNGTDVKQITKSAQSPRSVKMDNGGKYLYFIKKGKLARLNIKNDKSESLPFSANMDLNFSIEKKQIFEEAWRALNTGFYDPNFHGKDWNKLKEKFEPWALKASTSEDFQDIYNVMLGQLNASHMGLRNVKDRAETQKEKTGLLGIEIKQEEDGLKIMHIVPDSPADKLESKLNAGEIILSVNGKPVDSKINFYSMMINTAGKKIILQVNNKNSDTREVIIQPVGSLRQQLYNEWVEEKSKLVDKYSNGRLGYLHIQAMGMTSFERFERELTAKGLGKDGIVIDVRFNGGGWTTDYLMTVLNYKQHAYTIPRGAAENLEKDNKKFSQYYPLGERLPFAAWTKPSIAICNQNSYSNAEIFSHAYKTLGIGTLVGVPTFGAVISTGARTLIDGSYVRLPGRGWYVKATGKNMENGPAVPDIIVYNSPDAKAKGKDEQLKRAVEELLKQIDRK